MSKPLFRVKRYEHRKYKFLVRGKVLGKWKRRYFVTESEAISFAEHQNAKAQKRNGSGASARNGAAPRPAELPRVAESTATTDFAKFVTPTYIGPQIQRYLGDSWSMHLPFAYDLMRELAPRVFVELGVKQGESYFSFCQSAAENNINVKCYGIDSWRGDVQTGKLDPKIQKEVARYNWRYSSFSELKAMTFAKALRDFPDATIDLLHIDGAHTYSDVKTDFESWLPKLSPHGIILFHDVMLRDRGFGVWKVWDEITPEHDSFLFEFGYGLGVWKKEPVAPSDCSFIRRLLTANEPARRDINVSYANAAAALALWQDLRKQSDATNEVARLERENEEKIRQVFHFKDDAEERAKHVAILQRENKKKTRQVFHFKSEAEEQARQVAQLHRDVEEKAQQLAHFQSEVEGRERQVAELQRENDQQCQRIERLMSQIQDKHGLFGHASKEVLDLRWEVLTARAQLLRHNDSVDPPSFRLLQLETLVETVTSERDHLRTMLTALQSDIDQQRATGQVKETELEATTGERDHLRTMLTALQNDIEQERVIGQRKESELRATHAQLEATTQKLRSEQKQMKRLRERFLGKLILPFGRSQTELQQLAAHGRTDD